MNFFKVSKNRTKQNAGGKTAVKRQCCMGRWRQQRLRLEIKRSGQQSRFWAQKLQLCQTSQPSPDSLASSKQPSNLAPTTHQRPQTTTTTPPSRREKKSPAFASTQPLLPVHCPLRQFYQTKPFETSSPRHLACRLPPARPHAHSCQAQLSPGSPWATPPPPTQSCP